MTPERRLKLMLTLGCYFSYFSFAFGFYIVAPTLLDIKDNVKSTFQEVAYGVVVRSTTYCFAALFSGWFFGILNRRLGLIISTIVMASTCFVIPFLCKLYQFILVTGLMGVASAGMEVAVNAWMLELWQEDCNVYMQGMHFAYAIGVTIAPTLAAPFLSDAVTSPHDGSNQNVTYVAFNSSEKLTSPYTLVNSGDHLNHHLLPQSNEQFKVPSTVGGDLTQGLLIPYSITAIVLIISAIVQAILYFILPYGENARSLKPPEIKDDNSIALTASLSSEKRESTVYETATLTPDNSSKLSSKPRSYMTVMIISGCALTCFYAGLEMNSFIFLPDFAVALNYSKASGAYLTALMSTSYALFRFFGIFFAVKFKTINMLYAHVSLIGLSNFIIWYASYYSPSEFFLRIGVIALGAGCSCVYPAIYSYLEEKITVTNGLCGLFMFTSSIATSVNPIIEGHYLESHPSIFVGINTVGFVYVMMILVMVEFTYRKY